VNENSPHGSNIYRFLPRVSIITVVFNGEKSLEKCIKSVTSQSYENVEYIIVDGNSTDLTVDIIKRNEEKISYWISEPDKGIYDAMNKALKVASGEWIYFLGSDDVLIDSNIIASIFNENVNLNLSEYKLLFGNIKYDKGRIFVSSFTKKILLKNTIHHQGAFYNKDLFTEFTYNIKFSVYADYELNLLLFLSKSKTYRINKIIALCSSSGLSDTPVLVSYLQEIKLRHQHLFFGLCLPLDILTILRFGFKKCFLTFKKLEYLAGYLVY
jgi:putative colanic acid biosynthesis glycosyltransferase